MRRSLAVLFTAVVLFASSLTPSASPLGLTGSSQDRYFLNLNTVGLITCLRLPDGLGLADMDTLSPEQKAASRIYTGTGTIIARNRILTAAHVVDKNAACLFKDRLVAVAYIDRRLDTAVLTADLGDTPVTPVNCDGLRAGVEYLGFGYAHGVDFAAQRLTFAGGYADQRLKTGEIAHHQALLGGEAHPGMSGGPIVNGAGEVVAIFNTGGPRSAGARNLVETPLCAALQWKAPQP
ncbi:serine protease [Brevundimonas phage vB_BpoS-Domovoi]|uniref:Serine protease n=1 Tax=Brevundimonas phage vB_BpoS-Domovoi TaxID=2948598 RepID=A0A9E7MRY4_9CAUD|nr:serine protease [Brevundimonas phage vB_BpoS-Domovoi]